MQQAFYKLADKLNTQLSGDEVLQASLSGEESDFVRFNKSLVRQAGRIQQWTLTLELIRSQRHMAASCTLGGCAADDTTRATQVLADLRDGLASVPEDPYLLYNTSPQSTQQVGPNCLPDAGAMADAVLAAGRGLDLVGILASGGVFAGFANSLGQRNWFSTHSFNLGWCFYHSKDKAVKSSYAGFEWDRQAFSRKVDAARQQLAVLGQPARTIEPGEYHVYLAPDALAEVMGTLCWGGFGLKAHKTKTTSLLKMIEGGATLSSAITLTENTGDGLAPNFYDGGFIRPAAVSLIDKGRLNSTLASPRSAREYGVQPSGSESPESLDMAGGDLTAQQATAKLDTGVYVNRLWYLNYSDRPACRMTGMTRFATFWVEGGKIAAPLNVMRFDETIYRMLGTNLLALTRERDLIVSDSTYGGRSTSSMRLPGALVDRFAFTL